MRTIEELMAALKAIMTNVRPPEESFEDPNAGERDASDPRFKAQVEQMRAFRDLVTELEAHLPAEGASDEECESVEQFLRSVLDNLRSPYDVVIAFACEALRDSVVRLLPLVSTAHRAKLEQVVALCVPYLIVHLSGSDNQEVQQYCGNALNVCARYFHEHALKHLRVLMLSRNGNRGTYAIVALEGLQTDAMPALPELLAAIRMFDERTPQGLFTLQELLLQDGVVVNEGDGALIGVAVTEAAGSQDPNVNIAALDAAVALQPFVEFRF